MLHDCLNQGGEMTKSIKLLGSLLLSLFATSSFGFDYRAGTCETYFGLGIGPENVDFRQKVYFIDRPTLIQSGQNFPPPGERVFDKTHAAGNGGFFSIFGGIASKFPGCGECDKFYIALELNANARSLHHRRINTEYVHVNFGHTFYKLRNDYGISVLPGIFFNSCSLIYARLGYVNSRLVTSTNDESLQNIKKNLSGLRYGLGFRQAFDECLALRLEYSQNIYKRGKMFAEPLPGVISKSTYLTPYTQRFEVALIYTF